MASRDELIAWCEDRLRGPAFRDAGVNGLQVEGATEVRKLAAAVSTSLVTIDAALAWGADALLVHHGLLWGGELGPINGVFARRLRRLFAADLNLIAYHLPLDAHPEIGNNALLAAAAGYERTGRFASIGGEPLGVIGERMDGETLEGLSRGLTTLTGREPTIVGGLEPGTGVRRVGFLSGSGYGSLEEARAYGCRALVTGDIREPTMSEARELEIAVIAAGHEATERLGVQALARELAARFDLETPFISDPNPI